MHRHEHQEATVAPSKVSVYSKTTGRKQVIPAAWLDHPVLGADFQKTPLSRKREAASKTAPIIVASPVEPVEQAGSEPVTDDPDNGNQE